MWLNRLVIIKTDILFSVQFLCGLSLKKKTHLLPTLAIFMGDWLAGWLTGFVHDSKISRVGMPIQTISGCFMAFTHALYTVRTVQLFAVLNS